MPDADVDTSEFVQINRYLLNLRPVSMLSNGMFAIITDFNSGEKSVLDEVP
jgi:hypothetical protein